MNKKEKIENIVMVEIPAGSFTMGHIYGFDPDLPETVNRYYPDEQPLRKMSVKKFQMGETPVTQKQFEKIAGFNHSTFKGGDLPVTNIGPFEIKKFCNTLSVNSGFQPCYDEKTGKCDFSKNGFRLPTEKEWEYSCRAGTTSLFYTGNTEKDLARAGWYIGNSGEKTHPVAGKEPNAWGLFDMHGNVFEFCDDDWNPAMSYGRYLPENQPDPIFSYYHTMNVTRGGSWFSEPAVCRSACRACFCSWEKIYQSYYMGFRLARSC